MLVTKGIVGDGAVRGAAPCPGPAAQTFCAFLTTGTKGRYSDSPRVLCWMHQRTQETVGSEKTQHATVAKFCFQV